jgi:hypothetical protein
MPAQSRSNEPITAADLRRLAEIARADRERMFRTNSSWRPYKDRLLAVTLCQGAALHYLDGRAGVKDFDVWTFFARAPERPFPDAALFRRRKIADFGSSRFGRTTTAPEWMEGRRVDLFARSLDAGDSAEAIRPWLTQGRTETARRLAEKAVIEIEPTLGRVIWPA